MGMASNYYGAHFGPWEIFFENINKYSYKKMIRPGTPSERLKVFQTEVSVMKLL